MLLIFRRCLYIHTLTYTSLLGSDISLNAGGMDGVHTFTYKNLTSC